MKQLATLALLCATLALSACAHRVTRPATDQGAWPLLSPGSLGATLTANQVLRVAYGERDATLSAVLAVNAEQITIVGLTATGLRAFTVKYDGQAIQAEAAPGVPQTMPPERLLNDVQLVYWPLAKLKSALAQAGLEITEPFPGTRRVRRNGSLLQEVHYARDAEHAWESRAWLVNLELDYTLAIDSSLVGAQGL